MCKHPIGNHALGIFDDQSTSLPMCYVFKTTGQVAAAHDFTGATDVQFTGLVT